MSTEQEASSPAADSTQQAPQTAPEQEVTLDDVYKSVPELFEPAQPAPQPQYQQPAPQQYRPPSAVPDPYDVDAFKAYQEGRDRRVDETQHALRQVADFLSAGQRKEAQAALDADIKSAVDTVNEIVGHPKARVVEAMLDAKARDDGRFKALFENRSKNPAAWNNALKAVGREFAADLSVKVDPALVAANRARKLAQSQMATTDGPKSDTEEWESMSATEQQAKMNRMLHDGMQG